MRQDAGSGRTTMRHLLAHAMVHGHPVVDGHSIAHGLDELRVLTLLATAAFVTGGAVSSLALTLAWLAEHFVKRGALP